MKKWLKNLSVIAAVAVVTLSCGLFSACSLFGGDNEATELPCTKEQWEAMFDKIESFHYASYDDNNIGGSVNYDPNGYIWDRFNGKNLKTFFKDGHYYEYGYGGKYYEVTKNDYDNAVSSVKDVIAESTKLVELCRNNYEQFKVVSGTEEGWFINYQESGWGCRATNIKLDDSVTLPDVLIGFNNSYCLILISTHPNGVDRDSRMIFTGYDYSVLDRENFKTPERLAGKTLALTKAEARDDNYQEVRGYEDTLNEMVAANQGHTVTANANGFDGNIVLNGLPLYTCTYNENYTKTGTYGEITVTNGVKTLTAVFNYEYLVYSNFRLRMPTDTAGVYYYFTLEVLE